MKQRYLIKYVDRENAGRQPLFQGNIFRVIADSLISQITPTCPTENSFNLLFYASGYRADKAEVA